MARRKVSATSKVLETPSVILVESVIVTDRVSVNLAQASAISAGNSALAAAESALQAQSIVDNAQWVMDPPSPILNLSNLEDVEVASPQQGDSLRWNEEDSTWQNVSTVNNLGSFPVNENPTEYADGQTYTQVIKRDNYNEPLKEVWSYVGVVGNEHTFRLTSLGFTKYQTKSDIAGTGSKFKYIKIYDPKGLYQPPKYCTLRAQGQLEYDFVMHESPYSIYRKEWDLMMPKWHDNFCICISKEECDRLNNCPSSQYIPPE